MRTATGAPAGTPRRRRDINAHVYTSEPTPGMPENAWGGCGGTRAVPRAAGLRRARHAERRHRRAACHDGRCGGNTDHSTVITDRGGQRELPGGARTEPAGLLVGNASDGRMDGRWNGPLLRGNWRHYTRCDGGTISGGGAVGMARCRQSGLPPRALVGGAVEVERPKDPFESHERGSRVWRT